MALPFDEDMNLKPISGQIDGFPIQKPHRGLSSRHVQFLA